MCISINLWISTRLVDASIHNKDNVVTVLILYPFIFFPLPGCLNGGGQVKAEDGENAKELLSRVEDLYNTMEMRLPDSNPNVEKIYTDWLEGVESEKARTMLHTQYHEVEKMENALVIKW